MYAPHADLWNGDLHLSLRRTLSCIVTHAIYPSPLDPHPSPLTCSLPTPETPDPHVPSPPPKLPPILLPRFPHASPPCCNPRHVQIWGYVIGTFCGAIANLAPATFEFRRNMDDLNSYLAMNRVNKPLGTRLRE